MTGVPAAALRDFASRCYRALGVPAMSADIVADTLVQADLWGHQSHGLMRLFWYATRIKSGAIYPDASAPAAQGTPAICVFDGAAGLGQVVAHAAMTQAIAVAKANGIGAVAVKNSGHFGTAMYFTRMAAKAGCVGFLSTNASPAMAPWGGRDKRVSNNPWSWAAPAGKYPPMVLDIANTAVARGKLYLARQRGETIPAGWAIDHEGLATTDPSAGIAGTILPMAGHKGYAISTLMDMLSGVLSGSAFGQSVVGPYVAEGKSGVGHLAIAIDIAACRPLADFESDMEHMIETLKAAPKAAGTQEICYPGEIEARSEVRGLAEGIVLPAQTINDLRDEAAAIGVTAPF